MKNLRCTCRYLLGVALVAAITCSDPDHIVSSNHQTSSCNGFSSLQKRAVVPYERDLTEYCSAEKIRWTYVAAEKKLSLLHTRRFWNCAAKVKMVVKKRGEVYTMVETDERDPRGGAACSCPFDTYCEVDGVEPGIITLALDTLQWRLELDAVAGMVVIDSSGNLMCE